MLEKRMKNAMKIEKPKKDVGGASSSMSMQTSSERPNIGSILNHNYLKDALEERVSKNLNDSVYQKIIKRDNLTKATTLRSKSVARTLKAMEFEE